MKKFIVFIITAIILAVGTSFTAKAQYVYPQQTTEQGQVVQQKPINILQLPEYKAAQDKERKGKTLTFVGLGMQVVGAGLMFVPTQTSYTYEDRYGAAFVTETNQVGVVCTLIGAASAIAGSVMEVVGICKWINGATTIRDIRIAYSLSNGGIVVAF